jgi:hypothetical protein
LMAGVRFRFFPLWQRVGEVRTPPAGAARMSNLVARTPLLVYFQQKVVVQTASTAV